VFFVVGIIYIFSNFRRLKKGICCHFLPASDAEVAPAGFEDRIRVLTISAWRVENLGLTIAVLALSA